MQQDCAKATDNGESKLHCEIHPENELQILYFGETSQRKSRMLCVQCVIESNNKGENLNQFVYLNKFLIDPKITIFKIHNMNNDSNQENISKNLNEIDKLILLFEEIIKNEVEKLKENIQQMKIYIQQIGEEISNELKLNDVVKQIQLLKQMDSCQGTSELANLENQLNYIGENLNKCYLNLYNKVQVIQNRSAKNLLDRYISQTILSLQIIKNDLEDTQKRFIENLVKLDLLEATQKKIIDNLSQLDLFERLEDIKDFPSIHQQISERKQIGYQLLYQGTIDGLNAQTYWAKCNQQQNLLTIMTSKNGNKFGGYSPCQINQSQIGTYVEDPTMKSFIFQYTKKEMYKLKNKKYAVYCHQNYGPSFGQVDIFVKGDFQNGHSQYLGHSYDRSGYDVGDNNNHIFGAATPQLQECKVYKVIFK